MLIRAANWAVYIVFASLCFWIVLNGLFPSHRFDFSGELTAKGVFFDPPELAGAQRIFDARLAQYHLIASDLRTMLYGMVVVVGVSIYTTIARPTEFELPFLKLKGNAVWLRWTCPLILMYLWLHFGYALFSALSSRVFLLDLGHLIETGLKPEIAAIAPLKYSIEDGGIGDFIFYLLSPQYVTTREPVNVTFSWVVLVGLYGSLLGVVHGAIVGGIVSWMRVAWSAYSAALLLIAVFVLVLGSHAAFNTLLPALWPMDAYVCAIAMATFYLLPTDGPVAALDVTP